MAKRTIRFPEGQPNRVTIPAPIRKITRRAFYRRFNRAERKAVRESNADAAADLRDDLRDSVVVDLDDLYFIALLNETPMSPARILELLADGTKQET